jgi:aminotransferase
LLLEVKQATDDEDDIFMRRPALFPESNEGIAQRVLALPRVGSRLTDSLIEDLQSSGQRVLPLTAYPRRPLPEPVIEAAYAAISQMSHAPAQGLPDLRASIARRLTDELSVSVSAEQVVITNGAMDALNVALTALLDPDDEVLIFSPCYFFEGIVRLAGGHPRYVRLEEKEGYAFDAQKLEASISARTKAILFTTPNNPTRHVATQEELQGIAQVALRHRLFIVTDESYDRLVYDGRRYLSIYALPDMAERTFLVRSFTKSYSLADWCVGYLVCPYRFVPSCVKVLEWRTLYNNSLAQKVAAAVLNSDDGWLDGLAEEFQRNRDLMLKELREKAGLSAVKSQGNPFLFVNVERLGISCERFSELLLTKFGVPTTPGCWHQESGHFRIAFGGKEETVREAIERIQQTVETIEARR